MLVLTGAKLFDGERFHEDSALLIEGARISAIVPHKQRPRGAETRDLGGGWLAPGFVDVQVNGGGGALLNDKPSLEVVRRIAESHRRFGTTGMLPTLVTDAPEAMAAGIAAVRTAVGNVAGVLGIHLELSLIHI